MESLSILPVFCNLAVLKNFKTKIKMLNTITSKKQFFYLTTIIAALCFTSCSNNKNEGEQSSANTEVEKATEMSSNAVENAPPVTAKKYELKSGIITFETMMEMSGMKISGKTILYFDDYGMKECREKYEDGKLKESFLSDGVNLISLYHENKLVVKSGKAYRGTEMRFEWNEISQKDKDAGLATQGGKETVAGKDCETFTVITQTAGAKTATKYAGWNHIVLSMELNSKDMKSTTKAVKIEENIPVPAEKFIAPADYKSQN